MKLILTTKQMRSGTKVCIQVLKPSTANPTTESEKMVLDRDSDRESNCKSNSKSHNVLQPSQYPSEMSN